MSETTTAEKTVVRFLELLQENEVDEAVDLLAADVVYENVGLPTLRGREKVRHAFHRAMRLPGAGFEVYFHKVATDGGTVLTERTDVLIVGPVRMQIWVCGRFDVSDGAITLWRDYFDFWNALRATVRGIAGAAIPPLRPKPPVTAG